MPQFERFIDNLIEMRSHYSQLLQQSDRSINLAQDSLVHINALLVNELSGNQLFIENLTQLKSHYQSIIEENDRASRGARVQLNHINALLAEQLIIQQGNEQAISLQARSVNAELAIAETMGEANPHPVVFTGVESLSDSLPTANPLTEAELSKIEDKQPLRPIEDVQLSPPSSPSELSAPSDSIPENEINSVPVEIPAITDRVAKDLKSVKNDTLTAASNDLASQPIEVQQQITPQVEDNFALEPTKQAIKQLKRPLLTPYQHLSKSEAVEKLLTDEIGNILHIDYIVRALYGELELAAFKAEKSNTYDVLSKGVKKGLWDKVPDRAGCYTSDLKLAIGEPDTNQLTNSRQEISAVALAEALPPDYRGLKLTQAVEKVLQGNPGLAMNSEKIAQILFDKAEEDIFAAAKSKIGKVLWSGANQERWRGVPGKLGVYRLDLEKN